jgi:hypothetical protein
MTIQAAQATVRAIRSLHGGVVEVRSLQDYHAGAAQTGATAPAGS